MSGSSEHDVERMRARLREFHEQDTENDFPTAAKRLLADPIRPEDANGRFRPHPLLVLLLTFVVIALGTFFFFSFFHHEPG
jgi:hypothetical protein